MSACLWADIDAYLDTNITADMGMGGLYDTLQLVQVEIGDQFDPDHVSMPFCLIRGLTASYAEISAPHGDGLIHYDDITYPYELIVACRHATLATAKANVQELLRRLREFVRQHIALDGLTSTDGETVMRVEPRQIRVEPRGLSGVNEMGAGSYLLLGVLEIDILCQI